MDTLRLTIPPTPLARLPCQLLDLPNEVIMRIIAQVDFALDMIHDLRLVNRQFHDLLTSSGSVMQLKNEIARTQYPIANSLRSTSGNHTWNTLQELQDDSDSVSRIMRCMRQLDTESHRSTSNSPHQRANTDPSESYEDRREFLLMGLHLLAALYRAQTGTSELEMSYTLIGLGCVAVALMRFKTSTLRRYIHKQELRDPFTAWKLAADRSSATLAIEDLIVRRGIRFAEHLLEKDLSIDHRHHTTASGICAEFDAAQDQIESSLNVFLAIIVLGIENGEEFDTELEDALNARNARLTRPSWSVLANDLLIDCYIMHAKPLDSGCEEGDIAKALFDFLMEVGALIPNPQVQVPSTFANSEVGTDYHRYAMLNGDMYDVVERHISKSVASGRVIMAAQGGCLPYIARALQAALKRKERVTEAASQKFEGVSPRHTFLSLVGWTSGP